MSEHKLQQLAKYLRGLPSALAIKPSSESRYNFKNFEPDVDWIEDIGLVGAVNQQLEIRLGTRADGPIEFTERGPPVEALVNVLDRYTKDFPNNVLLEKWVDDALAGAIHTFSKLETPLPDWGVPSADMADSTRHAESAPLGRKRGPSLTNTASESVPVAKKSKGKAAIQTKLSGFVKSDINHNPDDLIDIDSEPESKGGRPRTTLLHDVTRSCKAISSGKMRYRCAMDGCQQSWSGRRQASRVYNHLLNECHHVDSEMKQKIAKATSA
ncbi:hypothetical protein PILCRDRAFT_9688 [Piloderma croceum F 1598]|uniref:Uncharacterized protein n=1 Tax=Piloderma croceum (strain F 1598) TaxID=765440 RepID=A0A0C3F692_PILCF|nr:hypothetical protein PILCRDRAFT_9688 [Piloderma croceum F 1598]